VGNNAHISLSDGGSAATLVKDPSTFLPGPRSRGRATSLQQYPVTRISRYKYVFLIGLLIPVWVSAADVFRTQSAVSSGPATPMLEDNSGVGDCPQGPISSPLRLFDAVERTLCTSPKTHAAWANVKAAAARIGESRSAYLPTLSGSAEYIREHVSTAVTDDSELESSYAQGVKEGSLSLSWVLYDFGYRSAALNGNRALLAAAQASQNATLQTVFAAVAKDYFDAQSADAKVQSTRRIEEAAGQILEAASARVSHGASPITDQLQANTAHAEAVYQRAKAVADSRAALGGV
jgi:outer membrane protein